MSLNTLSKIFFTIGTLIIISLFFLGLQSYIGKKIYYIIFSIVSNFLFFYSFRKNKIFFEFFFSVLLWLGFWFKFTIQIVFFNSSFPEGSGMFDYTSSSFDELLSISSTGLLAVILASILREKYIFSYSSHKKSLKVQSFLNNKNFITNYKKNRFKLIIIYIFFASIIFLFNYYFSFFQKGIIPKLILPFHFNNILKWLIYFGLTIFLITLLFSEVVLRINSKFNFLYFSLCSLFFSAISQLSRAMIFDGTSILLGFYMLKSKIKIKYSIKEIIFSFIFLFFLFFLSVFIVNKIRVSKNFNISYLAHNFINIKKNESTKPFLNVINDSFLNEINDSFLKEVNHMIFLFSARWVGIEGLMSVSSYPNKSYDLFFSSFKEDFNLSNSFYENIIKNNFHKFKESTVKIYTVYTPGLFAFLFYAGNKFFLFISIILFCLICSFIEYFSFKFSMNNYILSSFIGNILAYRLAHFGYMPLETYKLIITLIMNIMLVKIIISRTLFK